MDLLGIQHRTDCYAVQRATTTGIVLSGFGLSAFFFSTIASIAFPGDTSSFLLVLAVGTAFPMIMGFFLVRPIPLPASEMVHHSAHEDAEEDEALGVGDSAASDSQTPLLSHEEDHLVAHRSVPNTAAEEYVPDPENSYELSPPRSQSPVPRTRSASAGGRSLSRGGKVVHDAHPNVYGRALWSNGDFWLLWAILSMCAF